MVIVCTPVALIFMDRINMACILELKEKIIEKLEGNTTVLVCSLDLLAAFDLLCPDSFIAFILVSLFAKCIT